MDLAVRDEVDAAFLVAQRERANLDLLDRAGHPRHADLVADGDLVLGEDEDAAQAVAHEALRPEPDCDPHDPRARDERPDVDPQDLEDEEDRDPGQEHGGRCS